MKQEERNRLQREKIMSAALQEFGEKSYAEASINAICAAEGISKGNVYHYYKNKEALYLACVSACFQKMQDYLEKQMPPMEGTTDENLSLYFDTRLKFLEEYPCYQGIFHQATTYPPYDLREQVMQIRASFDSFNFSVLQAALKSERLREPVTYEDFAALQKFYITYCNTTPLMEKAAAESPAAREALCRFWVDVLLHGVVVQTSP